MDNLLRSIVDNSNRAVVLYQREQAKTLYANKLAVSLYGDVDGSVNMEQLLMGMDNPVIVLQKAREAMEETGEAFLYDFMTRSVWGGEKLTDIQMGYADPERTKIFMKLTVKEDNRLERACQQMDRSHKPEAILNFDPDLSIVYCNSACHRLLDSSDKQFQESSRCLPDFFPQDKKEKLLAEIQKELRRNPSFYLETKLETFTGEKKEVSIDFHHRTLDAQSRKLLVSFDVMDEPLIRASKFLKFHSLSQYFEAIQAISGDCIFLVDVKERIVIHKGRDDLGLPEMIRHFPESAYPFIHPDEWSSFQKKLSHPASKDTRTFQIRLKTKEGDYQSFEVLYIGIASESGEILEILGKITEVSPE